MSVEVPPKPPHISSGGCVLLLLASTLNYMDRQRSARHPNASPSTSRLPTPIRAARRGVQCRASACGAILIGCVPTRNIRLIYPVIVISLVAGRFCGGFAESFTFLLICRFALGLFEAGNILRGVHGQADPESGRTRAPGMACSRAGRLERDVTPLVAGCLLVAAMGTSDPRSPGSSHSESSGLRLPCAAILAADSEVASNPGQVATLFPLAERYLIWASFEATFGWYHSWWWSINAPGDRSASGCPSSFRTTSVLRRERKHLAPPASFSRPTWDQSRLRRDLAARRTQSNPDARV